MLGECECESGKDEEQAENLLIMSQAELQASKATRSKGGQYRCKGLVYASFVLMLITLVVVLLLVIL